MNTNTRLLGLQLGLLKSARDLALAFEGQLPTLADIKKYNVAPHLSDDQITDVLTSASKKVQTLQPATQRLNYIPTNAGANAAATIARRYMRLGERPVPNRVPAVTTPAAAQQSTPAKLLGPTTGPKVPVGGIQRPIGNLPINPQQPGNVATNPQVPVPGVQVPKVETPMSMSAITDPKYARPTYDYSGNMGPSVLEQTLTNLTPEERVTFLRDAARKQNIQNPPSAN